MKFEQHCDLLIGNRPENDSDEQYYECEDCYRYEICKRWHESQEENDRMSMISEQVKELKWYASYQDCEKVKKMMYQAADTIESLSAKLQAANLESSADCGGWIYCSDGKNMPKEEGFYLVSLTKRITDIDDMRIQKVFFSEKSNSFVGYGSTVIAWKPLPEPYHEP